MYLKLEKKLLKNPFVLCSTLRLKRPTRRYSFAHIFIDVIDHSSCFNLTEALVCQKIKFGFPHTIYASNVW